MFAKPLQMALGSLMIQKQYDYSGRELVEQITENPYYQYFVGLPGFQDKAPFVSPLLVKFRKRLNDGIVNEINEMINACNAPDDLGSEDGGGSDSNAETKEPENSGTIILDATCASQNIILLHETRENLEKTINETFCDYNYYRPHMYRENARRDYLNLVKCKKRMAKKIHKVIKQQLQYVHRDFGYVEGLLSDGVELYKKQLMRYMVLKQVYEQQQYMYENQVHTVPDRTVSTNQPYIRPIVRGKAAVPVEFGAKLDLSIDENGMARLEKLTPMLPQGVPLHCQFW